MDDFTKKSVADPTLDSETKQALKPLPPPVQTSGPLSFIKSNKYFVLAIIFGIAILSLLSFFVLRSDSAPSEADVAINVNVPEEIPSGTETILKVIVENKDPNKLIDMEMETLLPDGVSYVSSVPKAENLSGTVYTIPDLSNGQNASVITKLKVQGAVGDEKKIKVVLRYKMDNFSSDFTKEAEATFRITASGVSLNLEGPSTVTNGQLVAYELSYENTSDETFDNARIEITYPQGFSFAQAEPEPSVGKNIWNLGQIVSGANGKISIRGSYTSSVPGEERTIEAEFQVQDDSGNYYPQSSASFITRIQSQPLIINQTLSGKTENLVANPGDTLTFEVTYQNNSAVAQEGVNIVAVLDSPALDYGSIQAEGAQVSNNTVTWNAASDSGLGSLGPNDNGKLRVSVKLKNPPVKDQSENINVKSTVKIKSVQYGEFMTGNQLIVKVTSLSSLRSQLEYISGNLPPKVGQSTTYKVKLTLRNLTNDYTNGTVSAFLAVNAAGFDLSSVNSEETGKVKFDPSTGKITWDVGALPAHTGDFAPVRELSFNVRVTPVSSNVGKPVTLIKTIRYTGTDSYLNTSVVLNTDDITTQNIQGQGTNKGNVVK